MSPQLNNNRPPQIQQQQQQQQQFIPELPPPSNYWKQQADSGQEIVAKPIVAWSDLDTSKMDLYYNK